VNISYRAAARKRQKKADGEAPWQELHRQIERDKYSRVYLYITNELHGTAGSNSGMRLRCPRY